MNTILPPKLPTHHQGEKIKWIGRWRLAPSFNPCEECGSATTIRFRLGRSMGTTWVALACSHCHKTEIEEY